MICPLKCPLKYLTHVIDKIKRGSKRELKLIHFSSLVEILNITKMYETIFFFSIKSVVIMQSVYRNYFGYLK